MVYDHHSFDVGDPAIEVYIVFKYQNPSDCRNANFDNMEKNLPNIVDAKPPPLIRPLE